MAEQPSPWAEEAVRQMKGAMRHPKPFLFTYALFCILTDFMLVPAFHAPILVKALALLLLYLGIPVLFCRDSRWKSLLVAIITYSLLILLELIIGAISVLVSEMTPVATIHGKIKAAICHMYRGTEDRARYTTDLNGDGEGDWVVAAQSGAQSNLLCSVRENGVWSADFFYNMAASGLSWMIYSERIQCPLLWIFYASFSGGSTQIMPYRSGSAECCARQKDEPLWESDPEGDPCYQSTYWVEGSEVAQAEHQSYVDTLGSVELAKVSAVKVLGEEWITGRRLGLNSRWLDTLAAMVAEVPFVTDRAVDINGDGVTDHRLTVTADRRMGPAGMEVSRYEGGSHHPGGGSALGR